MGRQWLYMQTTATGRHWLQHEHEYYWPPLITTCAQILCAATDHNVRTRLLRPPLITWARILRAANVNKLRAATDCNVRKNVTGHHWLQRANDCCGPLWLERAQEYYGPPLTTARAISLLVPTSPLAWRCSVEIVGRLAQSSYEELRFFLTTREEKVNCHMNILECLETTKQKATAYSWFREPWWSSLPGTSGIIPTYVPPVHSKRNACFF
jgi:hypothetical protein